MSFVFSAFAYVSIALQVLLVCFLFVRGQFRRYPLLLVYSVVFLGLTVAETLVFHAVGFRSPKYRYLYMTDEVIIDLLLFFMVIAMTYKALGDSVLRPKIGRLLAVVAVGAVLLPFVLFQGPFFTSQWFEATSQMLNFGAAIMNLALWTALLGNRKRDPLLLAVSAGLGIAVTGAAISYGLLHFKWSATGTPRNLVTLIKSLTHVAGLLIWCWAFWRAISLSQRLTRTIASP